MHPEKWGSREISAYTEAMKRGDTAMKTSEDMMSIHMYGDNRGTQTAAKEASTTAWKYPPRRPEPRVKRWQIVAVFAVAAIFFAAFAVANSGAW